MDIRYWSRVHWKESCALKGWSPNVCKPKMSIEKLLECGNMLIQEQKNVKSVQLADKCLREAALGDANKEAIKSGAFYG